MRGKRETRREWNCEQRKSDRFERFELANPEEQLREAARGRDDDLQRDAENERIGGSVLALGRLTALWLSSANSSSSRSGQNEAERRNERKNAARLSVTLSSPAG